MNLFPTVTTTERLAMVPTDLPFMCYDSTLNQIFAWNGTVWKMVADFSP